MAKPIEHLDESKRPVRLPVDGPRDMLSIPDEDPNYHYTWQPEYNVDRFFQGGYDLVLDDGVAVGQDTVNKPSKVNGWKGARCIHERGGVTQVLLRIRKEWREEDEARLAQMADEMEGKVAQPTEGGYGNVESDGGKAKVIIRNK
jgi:hypothetical protein